MTLIIAIFAAAVIAAFFMGAFVYRMAIADKGEPIKPIIHRKIKPPELTEEEVALNERMKFINDFGVKR